MSDLTPKKSLGQHWLHDAASLQAMVKAGEILPEDTVVEVGPGLGTLTQKLVEASGRVVAVEVDKELAQNLRGLVEAVNLSNKQNNDKRSKLEVIQGDILQLDLTKLPKNYKVVANIPYYLTSNLIRTMLESSNPPSLMALLMQKEVAERIVAQPGQMSILSVSVQFYAETVLKEIVPAELFIPPPKVDSQIIQIKRRETSLFPDVDPKQFFRLVKAGFSEKRKQLRSSLSGGLQISKSEVDELLEKAGIFPTARAQELSLIQWHSIYTELN